MDLGDQLLVGRLCEIIRVHICHGLTSSFVVVAKRNKTVQSRVFCWIHQILKFLVKRFASILVRLHSILDLVFTFFSPIKLFDSNKVERIGQQITFNFQINGTVTSQ